LSPPVRRRLIRTLVLLALLGGAFLAITLVQISSAADRGRQALLHAETALSNQDVRGARTDVARSQRAFASVNSGLHRIAPFRLVGRQVPLVRMQVRAVEAYGASGRDLSNAADGLVDAASAILEPEDGDLTIAQGLDRLRSVKVALDKAVVAVDASVQRVNPLRDERLIGRLGTTMTDFVDRITRVQGRAHSAASGLDALISFAGGEGDRRYLIFSQNTDEPRPTGGFIGTYGVLRATKDDVDLERYASIESWYRSRPNTYVPAASAPSAFHIPDPPEDQTIANVNATPDWRAASQLALKMWTEGGEPPVNGVIGITPELLAKVVKVLGPVKVPEYKETVTAANLVERMDFYTHLDPTHSGTAGRKDFVVQLADAVVQKMLDTPARKWDPLAKALGAAFEAREGVAWSQDANVEKALAERHWDGMLPDVPGDFFYASEFANTAKNGRALRRTFDHKVTLNADGSGIVETTMTIHNTAPPAAEGLLNIDSLAYITTYGPFSGRLAKNADKPYAIEKPLAGHPAWGGDRAAPPLGEDKLFVAWNVPKLLLRRADGATEYRLRWLRNLGNVGDVVHLDVRPPKGWRWRGEGPPSTIKLTKDFEGAWALERSGD
jgi:hypothetical protein